MAKEEYLVLSVEKDKYDNRKYHDFYVVGRHSSMSDALQGSKRMASIHCGETFFIAQVMSIYASDVTIKEL